MKTLIVICVCSLCVSIASSAQEPGSPGAGRAAEKHGASAADQRGYFGFVPRYDRAEDGSSGIRIVDILPHGPAEESRLAKDDLIITFNGEPLLFENDLEMMRKLGSVSAGTRLELTLQRGSEILTAELLPTVLPPDRARVLDEWFKIAEASYEAGACMRERAEKQAFGAFKQSIPATGARLVVTKDLASHEIEIRSASIAIPPDFDLSQIPLLSGLLRDLRPGDSFGLLCDLGDSGDELRIRPVDVPAYLQSHLTSEASAGAPK